MAAAASTRACCTDICAPKNHNYINGQDKPAEKWQTLTHYDILPQFYDIGIVSVNYVTEFSSLQDDKNFAMQLQNLEEASLNSWPAIQQMLLDGWVIRFANGYTKRANSVTPLYSSHQPLEQKIEFCERLYRERKQMVVFRLPTFSTPAGLEELLIERGYDRMDETYVMTHPLDTVRWEASDGLRLQSDLPLDEWMQLYSKLYGSSIEQERKQQAILAQIVSQRRQFVLRDDERVYACGVGVLEGDYFGLFNILTAPEWRGKGYAGQLLNGMMDWARQRGGKYAYLQVVADNASALRLYQKLNFQEAYRYWYRYKRFDS